MTEPRHAPGVSDGPSDDPDGGLLSDYDRAPFGDLATRPDWTILRVNQTFLDLVGLPRDGVVGQRLTDLLTPADRIFHETHYRPLLRLQGHVQEVAAHLVGADGTQHPVLLSSRLITDPGGTPLAIRTGVVSIADRRGYEDELLLARRRAESAEMRERMLRHAMGALAAADSTTDVEAALARFVTDSLDADGGSMWLLATDGRTLVRANPDGEAESLDIADDRPAAQTLRDRIVTSWPEHGLIGVPLCAGRRTLGVFLARRPGDTPPLSEYETTLGSLGRQAGQVIERAQLSDHKTWVLGMVAHDMRTPLTTIGGFARTLQDHWSQGLDDAGSLMLDRIVATTHRLSRLTDDLLAATTSQMGGLTLDRAPRALAPIVDSVVVEHRSAAADKEIELRCQDASANAEAPVDTGRIVQVIDNLVSNAIKYSPPGTSIDVTISATTDRVEVAVADGGPGISESDLPGLFTAFTTTANVPTGNETSTGLGLAIAQQVIRAHQGEIEVTTSEGGGSTFSFWLPRTLDHTTVP